MKAQLLRLAKYLVAEEMWWASRVPPNIFRLCSVKLPVFLRILAFF